MNHSMAEHVMNTKLIAAMDHLFNQCLNMTASGDPELATRHWDTLQHEISGIATAMIFLDLDTGAAWDHERQLMKTINAHRFVRALPGGSSQDGDQQPVSSTSE